MKKFLIYTDSFERVYKRKHGNNNGENQNSNVENQNNNVYNQNLITDLEGEACY